MIPDMSAEILKKAEAVMARYPHKRAALLPILHLIQKEAGCISPGAERWVAGLLGIKPVRVREMVTFYTLFRREPAGAHVIQACSNLSCTLQGAPALIDYIGAKLGIRPGETSADGKFTLLAVECLGNCDQAPCMMIDMEYHGRLTREKIDALLGGMGADDG